MVSWKTIKNGLSWTIVPTKEQMATIAIMIRIGSRNENRKHKGIAHILEHVLFKGTKNFPTALSWNQAVESIGGETNAFTTPEHTYFTLSVPTREVETALMMLADLVRYPLLSASTYETEKSVIIQEIIERYDPSVMIDDVTERSLFGDQPLGWNIVGSLRDIKAAHLSHIKSFYNSYYIPSLTYVGIAGNISEKKAQQLINKYFGSWKKHPSSAQKFKIITPKISKRPSVVVRNINDKTTLVSNTLLLPPQNKNKYIWTLWSIILGGGSRSRLYTTIREKEGLVYNIEAYTMWYSDIGYFDIFFESSGSRAYKIQKRVFDIINEFIFKKPTKEKELIFAKRMVESKLLRQVDDPGNLLVQYMIDRSMGTPSLTWQEQLELYNSVTLEEIHEASRRIAERTDWHTVWIGPDPDRKKIKKILVSHTKQIIN